MTRVRRQDPPTPVVPPVAEATPPPAAADTTEQLGSRAMLLRFADLGRRAHRLREDTGRFGHIAIVGKDAARVRTLLHELDAMGGAADVLATRRGP